jgi:hypothetical protein
MLFIEPILRKRINNVKEDCLPRTNKERFKYVSIDYKDLIKRPGDDKLGYVIIADSGMGKTTLLEELVILIAEKRISTDIIPIFFEFYNLKDIKDSSEIRKLIQDKFAIHEEKLINEWFQKNRFVFFIDGLDQVIGLDDTHFFKNIFEKNIFGNNHIIFSTRPFAYSIFESVSYSAYKFEIVEIYYFNDQMIKKYFENKYDDIMNKISFRTYLFRIPILLSYIKSLQERRELNHIRNKTDLYHKITKMLFSIEEIRRLLKNNNYFYAPEKLSECFSKISFYTLSKGHIYRFPRFLDKEELEKININEKEFKSLLEVGIISEIIEGDKKEIIYRHQSFQEYFASLKMKGDLFIKGELDEETLKKYLEYRYWDEVIIFLIGGIEEEEGKKIIKCIEKYDYELAALCLSEYKGNREDFSQLLEILFDNLNLDSISILTKIADIHILNKFIYLLSKDKNSAIQENAAIALRIIADERAVSALIKTLENDDDSEVRVEVTNALINIKSKRAVKCR